MSIYLPEHLRQGVHDLCALLGSDLTISFHKSKQGLSATVEDIKVARYGAPGSVLQAVVDGVKEGVHLMGYAPAVRMVRVQGSTLFAHMGWGLTGKIGVIFIRPLRAEFTESRLLLVSGGVAGYDGVQDLLTQLELSGSLIRKFMPDPTRWIQCS